MEPLKEVEMMEMNGFGCEFSGHVKLAVTLRHPRADR